MAKVALLIGVSEYEPGLNPLPAAVKDLDALKDVLLHPDIGGFAKSDVVILKNPERQVMEESIETLFANRHKDDLVLLFFSGHGIKDDAGRLYLATRKTRKNFQGELVRSSAVTANFVHENMSRSRSKRQVIILDSCFSGAFAEGLSAKDDGTVDIRAQLGGEGRVVLTSSSSTQYSFEQEGEELSLYTRFLVEGIKTGAADLDGDDMVSIDELHEYASRKVREVKPELKPELYAVREGFKIRLCKVPQGDPHERYKKEVTRCGKRGDLTIVSRSILDTWRVKLGLSIDEANALEDEALAPYRRDFHQKLKRYEETVADVLQRDGLVNNTTRPELQRLQQVLELRQEDTVPIEARAAALLKKHNQNLETYKQSFSEALRQEYPLGEVNRDRLQQIQRQLVLNDRDIAQIEAQITTEVETYRGNLQQYEQAFLAATQEGYPLSERKSADLQQYQLRLDLSDVEVAPIEAKITAQIETYQEKLQQYKETFASATQRKHQPGQANTSQLMQTWKTLGLKEEDVQAIEAPIREQLQTYQANLRRYEQAFLDATDQEYPVSRAKHAELRQRQRSLSLSDEDIASIENRITASIEEHLKSLQQYEQVFSDSIQFEFPVSEATREELRRFQQILELDDRDIAQLEEKVVSKNDDRTQNQSQQSEASDIASQTAEVNTTSAVPSSKRVYYSVDRTAPINLESKKKPRVLDSEIFSFGTDVNAQESKKLAALQEYEIEATKCINAGISLQNYAIRKNLASLRNTLGISRIQAAEIEVRLTRSRGFVNIPQSSNTASPAVQPQYHQENIYRSQDDEIFLAHSGRSPTQKPTNSFTQSMREIVAGLIIACGSLWSLFFICVAFSYPSYSFNFIFGLFVASLGLLAIWGGAKLWRS